MSRHKLFVTLAAVLALAAAWLLLTPSAAGPVAAVQNPAQAPDRDPGQAIAAAPGWIDVQGGTRRLALAADGLVSRVAVTEAQPVAAGTVLLQLDDQAVQLEQQARALELRQKQAAVQALRLQQKAAVQEVARSRALVQMQAEAGDTLLQAEAHRQAIDAELQAASLAVDGIRIQQQSLALQRQQLQIRAPVAGRVLRSDVHVGEAVARGMTVIWFAPDGPRVVRAEIDEQLLGRIQVGMAATVTADGGDGHRYAAKLLAIAAAVGPVRGLPEVRASARDDHVVECLLSLADAPLLIGRRVTVRIGAGP